MQAGDRGRLPHQLDGPPHQIGGDAAAGVQKVGGAQAGAAQQVQRGHAQPGAAGDDADLAFQRHERDAQPGGPHLRFAQTGAVQVSEFGLAAKGVVVGLHLAVQGQQAAVVQQGKRVDLDLHQVQVEQHGVQCGHHPGERAGQGLFDAAAAERPRHAVQRQGLVRGQNELVDGRRRKALDGHAAGRTPQEQSPAVGEIGHAARIDFVRDPRLLLDQHLADGEPQQLAAEQPGGRALTLIGCRREQHAAGLAAPAGGDQRFDDDLAAQGGRMVAGLGRGACRSSPRHSQAIPGKVLFGSVLRDDQDRLLAKLV